MTSRWTLLGMGFACCLVACGGGDGDGGGGARPDSGWSRDSSGGGEFATATVRGTVWAPGNAPGMAAVDEEIPVAGAIISYSSVRLGDIPSGAHCERCDDTSAIIADSKGNFELRGVPEGTHWLTIRKGLFRLDQQILVSGQPQEVIELTPEQSTLPSVNDPANGKYIPKIALANGLWDKVENILGKMRIGEVDGDGEFVGSSATGFFDLYINGSGSHGADSIGSLQDLVLDLPKLLTYHILFIGCSNGDTDGLFENPVVRENLREFVSQGGKLYVTDWSAEWVDVLWPEFIVFNGDYDTANLAGPYGDGNGSGNTRATASAMDRRLREWLDGQEGPYEGASAGRGVFDATSFEVGGLYDQITDIPNVMGVDEEGNQVVRAGYPWVQGTWTGETTPTHPFTLTFEREGCGRVLYSTYHTSDYAHAGLTPQERVLVFLIMELGVCINAPDID